MNTNHTTNQRTKLTTTMARLLVGGCAIAGLLAVPAVAQAAESDAPHAAKDPGNYWTPARMQEAKEKPVGASPGASSA